MPRKWKIFQREIEWYDIKTKFKKFVRGLAYSALMQKLICGFIISYMWLVYLSSQKKFVNVENFLANVKAGKPLMVLFWHNRLMMIPFVARFALKKGSAKYKFMTLASHHGDGQFVGRVMNNFGFQNIYGSSKGGRKASRGIDLHSLREIIRGLKNGKGIGITPDGPRGPSQKINGEIISIAKITNAAIIPISYSTSRFIQFNSWDQFKLPLPFSKLCFYFGDLIFVDKNLSKEDEASLRLDLEHKLNFVQEQSWSNVQ